MDHNKSESPKNLFSHFAVISATLVTFILLIQGSLSLVHGQPSVNQWDVFELTLQSEQTSANPYLNVDITAVFSGPGGIEKAVTGFWDGGNTFKVRFTPTAEGTWTYVTSSFPSDPGLTASGSLTVGPPGDNHGFVRIDPAYPNSFIFDDGTRYFMFGTTAYEFINNAMDDPTGSRWKASIDYLKSHGINKIRFFIYPSEYSLIPYSWWFNYNVHKYPDSQPFYYESKGNPYLNSLRIPHWQKLDEVIQYLASQEMIADIIVFADQYRNYGTDVQDTRYARYSLARYAAYPNVIWCSTNEFDLEGKPDSKRTISYWNQIGALLEGEDPWHYSDDGKRRPLSIHESSGDPGNPTAGLFDFFDSGWASHAVLQLSYRAVSDPNRYSFLQQITNNLYTQSNPPLADQWGNYGIIPNLNRNMPVVNDEFGYAGDITREENRQAMWGIYVAGGHASMGDCYDEQGRDVSQQGSDFNFGTCSWSHGDFYDMGEAKGVHDDVKHLIDFFTTKGIEYWKMQSNNSLVDYFRTERVYTLADPGNEYVVYSAAGNDFTITLESGNTYDAERFDPRSGLEVSLCTVPGGLQQFRAPPGSDWVFHITRSQTPPQNCTLTNAYWAPVTAAEGESVQLVVEGNNCNGEELSLEIREDDSFGGNNNPITQPETITFADGTATGTWSAEYYPDGTAGDPEYYFLATLLSDGSMAIDSQGNTLLAVSEDTDAPAIPLNLQASVQSSTYIVLSWDPSSDNVGVQGYKVFRDGNQITTSDVTTYHDTGLIPATAYTYSVSAFDRGGNESAESAPVTETTTSLPDTTPVDYYCDTDSDGHYDSSVSGSCVGGGCEPAGCQVLSGTDCNDGDAAINTGAAETWYDGVDQDCDGRNDYDQDMDGFVGAAWNSQAGGTAPGTDDCNDTDAAIYPGAAEIAYDGVDQDCSGADLVDVDNDGYDAMTVCADDCDDADITSNPGAQETWYDGVDQDCDGRNDYDQDRDGFVDAAWNGQAGGTAPGIDDCNDSDGTVFPGAVENAGDGVDQDCNGSDTIPCIADTDQDGYGTDEGIIVRLADDGVCAAGQSESPTADDCNDGSAVVNPGASEVWYDGADQDCDGKNDYDQDRDGYVDAVWNGQAGGTAPGTNDCSDIDPGINPGAVEVPYDGIDQDCSGVDLTDADGDGYLSTAVTGGTDCNDNDDGVFPDNPEACDFKDNNCNSLADEGLIECYLVDYYLEGFENGLPPGWSVTDNAGTGSFWRFDDPQNWGNITGGAGMFAIADSDLYKISIDTELRSSSLDMTGYTGVILEFKTDFRYYSGGGDEVADVDVSTDGGMDWLNIWRKSGADYRGPKTETIDITSLAAGQNDVMIRFHFYGAANDWWWQIDEMHVTAKTSGQCPPSIRIAGDPHMYYTRLQNAYDAAADFDTIQCQGGVISEDLFVDMDKEVTLEGGYDCTYTLNNGMSTLQGNKTVSGGRISIGNFILE